MKQKKPLKEGYRYIAPRIVHSGKLTQFAGSPLGPTNPLSLPGLENQ